MKLNDLIVGGIYEYIHTNRLWRYEGLSNKGNHKLMDVRNPLAPPYYCSTNYLVNKVLPSLKPHRSIPTPVPKESVNSVVSLVINDVYKHKVNGYLWRYKGFTKNSINHDNIHRFEYAGNSYPQQSLIINNNNVLLNFLKEIEHVKQKNNMILKNKFNIGDTVYLNPDCARNKNSSLLNVPAKIINNDILPIVEVKFKGFTSFNVDTSFLLTESEYLLKLNKEEDEDHYVKAEKVNGFEAMNIIRNLIRR